MCKLFTLPRVKVPYILPSCLGLSSVLSHNMLTWTTRILLILHNTIRISLQINVVFLVGCRRTTLKNGKSRKCYSNLGKCNSSNRPRLALGIIQPPVQWVRTVLPWKVSGRDMRIPTQFKTLPTLRRMALYPRCHASPNGVHKKIRVTSPLRRIENDFFLIDSDYIVRTEAAVFFILCQPSIT